MELTLRRGLLAQMAGSSGVQFITGTIAPTEAGSLTISFGRSLNDYILFLEMTDESISDMVNSGITTNYKGWCWLGKKSWKTVGNATVINKLLLQRYNMQTRTMNASTPTGLTMNDDNFKINCGLITNDLPGYLYIGYTYNYIIVPIA